MTGQIRIVDRKVSGKVSGSDIYSVHPFFKGELIVKRTEDGMEFRHPTLGYVGATKKGSTSSTGARKFYFADKLPPGLWHFDEEESDEDLVVVKFTSNEAKEDL